MVEEEMIEKGDDREGNDYREDWEGMIDDDDDDWQRGGGGYTIAIIVTLLLLYIYDT